MVAVLLDKTTEVGAGVNGCPVGSLKVNAYWNCFWNWAVKDAEPVKFWIIRGVRIKVVGVY
jgi:hypothetical protein